MLGSCSCSFLWSRFDRIALATKRHGDQNALSKNAWTWFDAYIISIIIIISYMESHGIARYTSISDIYTYVYLLYTNTHRHTSIYLALLYCHPFWVFFLEFGPWKLCSEANHHWKPGRGSHGSSRRVDVVELTSCWGGFFFLNEKKQPHCFSGLCDGSKVQKNYITDRFILALFVCIYFYFLAWRGEKTHARIGMACMGGQRLRLGAPFVNQFGIRD